MVGVGLGSDRGGGGGGLCTAEIYRGSRRREEGVRLSTGGAWRHAGTHTCSGQGTNEHTRAIAETLLGSSRTSENNTYVGWHAQLTG